MDERKMEESETKRILAGMSPGEIMAYVSHESGHYKRYIPVSSGTPLDELYFSGAGRFSIPDCHAMSLAKDFGVCRAERGQELGTTVQPSGYEQTYELCDIPVFDVNKFTEKYPQTHAEIYRPNGEDKYDSSREMASLIRQKMGSDVHGIKAISVSGYVQGRDGEACLHLWPEASGEVHRIDSRYWNGDSL